MNISEIIVDIIIPLISVIIGGALTLFGVIITIKHTNKINNQEFIERFKPVIRCYHPYDDFNSDNAKNVYFRPENELSCKSIYGNFSNTDKANFSINGIWINGVFHKLSINTHIKKSEDFIFDIYISEKNKITNIELEILDDYNRKYVYILDFATSKSEDVYIVEITDKTI